MSIVSSLAATTMATLAPYFKDPWTLSWIISSALVIFVPIIIWSSHRNSYYANYGRYVQQQDYYEEQQRYYEQKQKYYEQQQQNNYYNGNGNYQQQSYYKECSWINWPCRRRQWIYATYSQNNGGNNNGDRVTQKMPEWYIFLGGQTEDMQRWKEENNDNEGRRRDAGGPSYGAGMTLVYIMTLGLFIASVIYGAKSMMLMKNKNQSPSSSSLSSSPILQLTTLLIIMAILAFMNLLMNMGVLTAAGNDDRAREEEGSYYGWYGQTSVLLVYFDFWIMLLSFGYLIAFQVQNYLERRKATGISTNNSATAAGGIISSEDNNSMVEMSSGGGGGDYTSMTDVNGEEDKKSTVSNASGAVGAPLV